MEVDVPVLGQSTVTDPHIESIVATCNRQAAYLQTSPEFAMKRLLAVGSGDIFCLGKAFRDGESGSRHNPEFTMLEWYRVGWTEQQLMDEVAELLSFQLRGVLSGSETENDAEAVPYRSTKTTYRDLFMNFLQVNPHTASLNELRSLAQQRMNVSFSSDDKNTWLDLLFTHCIEPHLTGIVLVSDFPASQAALARTGVNAQGEAIAHRFEAYVNGIELANGYWELKDATEQARRFQADREWRKLQQLSDQAGDPRLLSALDHGLPDCAGVALGVDRLLMLKLGKSSLQDVLSFPFLQS